MLAAIKILEKHEQKLECDRKTKEDDNKRGFKGMRAHFDPIYYNAEEHNEIKAAIAVLKELRKGKSLLEK